MLSGLFLSSGTPQYPGTADAERTARRAAQIASDVQTKTESLQADVEKLFIVTNALWTILKEQHGYTDDRLVQAIADLDEKAANQPETTALCLKCERPIIRRQAHCLYCGADIQQQPFDR